jgi:AcrR family transcriptional regulator
LGVAERRERERELVRAQIIDATRDLLLERGLAGVSMRSIAERIEYSPAAIYSYFRDKDELLREVVSTGFERLSEVVAEELAVAVGQGSAGQYRALGRAYARFALANPAYFRVMFELPGTAELDVRCEHAPEDRGEGFCQAVALVQRAMDEGAFGAGDARDVAVLGWGMIHGLASLYLSGHLRESVPTPAAFFELIERAMTSMYEGWKPAGSGVEGR